MEVDTDDTGFGTAEEDAIGGIEAEGEGRGRENVSSKMEASMGIPSLSFVSSNEMAITSMKLEKENLQ